MSLKEYHSAPPNGMVTITIPANMTWNILYGHIVWNSTATVGQRYINFQIATPDGHIICDDHAGAKQNQSLTKQYALKQGIYRESAFTDDDINMAIPKDCIIPAGYSVKIWDSAEIDLNDTAEIHILYEQKSSSIYKR